MKRKSLLFFLLIALLAPLAMNGQTRASVTVADGTDYNTYVPIYTSYVDYGMKCEYIIPASELSDLPFGSQISAITIYQNTTGNWTAKTLTIKLANTSTSSYSSSSFLGNGGTTVYTNSSYSASSAASHTFTFNQNSPFTYTGGSLIVQISSENGGTWASSNWYGKSSSNNQAYYAYNNSSSGGTSYSSTGSLQKFIPKTSFTYTASTNPYITLSPTSATVPTGLTQTLTATYGNVTNPTITYSSSNTDVATVTGNGTTATVTGVAPGTATITATMNGTYTATCTVSVADLSPCEGFETDLGLWTVTADNSNYSWARKAGTGNSSYTSTGQGSYNVGAYYSSDLQTFTYLTLNADLSSWTDKKISFKYINPSWQGDIDYIYLQYTTDGTTYTNLASYTEGADSWTQVTDLAIPDAAKYIRFAAYSQYGYGVGLDDICLDYSSGNLHVTVWTETGQHEAWGTVQIGSDTPGTYVETYVNDGDQVIVTAAPDECHTFAYWIPNGGGNNITQNPATITVNADLDLQAVFTAITYNVTATPNNASYGSVSGGGNNFGCGSTCTLTATANTGYGFMGWQLNGSIVSTDNPYTITVNANAAYTAVFEQVSEHTITVTQATGGTISASANTAYMGNVITLTATPVSGYFFVEWIVEDASHNPITVTDDQFTMPNSDVTVTATFTQGFNVTLVQTANGTISANKTNNLQPGEHVTLTATPATDCVFLAWYAYKTGNPRDVIAVISNTTILMPASDVTVQAVFVTQEEQEAQLGSHDGNANGFPTYVRANYTLTQQIYLASELENQKGTITKIAYRATTVSCTRNLTIYMAHTDKSAFSSTTNWDMMAPQQKVFEGNVSFGTSDWTTITLDTPFEYDGERNINICVVDNTGSTAGSSSSYTQFYAYNVTGDRGMVAAGSSSYADAVGNASIGNITGSTAAFVNQIILTMLVPGNAEALTISPAAIDDFSYVEGQGPSQTHKLDIVGVDLQNGITLTAPTNFEISLTESGTYTSSLTIPLETGSKGNRTVTTWGFEGTMDGWTAFDVDNDGYNWVLGSASDGVYFDDATPSESGHNSSTDMLVSGSWTDAGHTALTPDNWLISQQVTLGGTFSMWAKPEHSSYTAEHFAIYVSTTGNNPSDFTEPLGEWTLTNPTWKQFSVDLSLYAGQTGYIAVRHFNCTDQFILDVDDFVLNTEATITIEMPVTITPATVFVRMKDNLNAGTYSGTLTASAGTGDNLNRSVSLSGEVIAAYNITLTANPTEGGDVAGAGSYVTGTRITVSASPDAPYSFINWTESTTEGTTVVSTDASYSFTVTADRTLVANFGFIKTIINRGDGGYQLIASPIGGVAPANVTNMTANNFDLYRYNANATLQWENYKQEGEHYHFNLDPGRGYLYANSETVDLVFMGAEYSGNALEVTLNAQSASGFKNWNLVGNPFAEIAHIETEDGHTLNYYTVGVKGGQTNQYIEATNTSIQPMEGVFVIAIENGEKITFVRGESKTRSSQLVLNVNSSRNLVDRAIVRFDECRQLPKFQLNEDYTKVYIPMDGEEYAVVHGEEMGELPVNFKAEENGHYSLNLSNENVEFAYLHLIDNLTGNEVDLLQTPNYSFEAKTTDYASRFKLVYATGDNSNSDNFAFFSNGSFVINNDGFAELQVVDIMGRILSSETINGCTNVSVNAAPGVYMLRLINGTDVKVQKVVVK